MKTRFYYLSAAVLFCNMALSQGFTVLQSGPNLNVARYGHSAVSLPNGNVLAIGGHTSGFFTTNTAEIYNPSSNTWTLFNITNAHDMLAMAKLSNGNYMFMGGCSSGYGVGQSTVTTIYNPTTNTFSTGPSMLTARTNSTATRLANGNVLVVGNWYNTGNAELYNDSTNQFVAVGTPPTERSMPLILPADDGTAFIIGGYGNYGGSPFTSVEKYDPVTNLITAHSLNIVPNETGWTTIWTASLPIIEEMRLSNGNYVFLLFKTVGGTYSYRIGQFNPSTKAFNIIETTPVIPDFSGATSDFSFSVSLMVEPITDYVYLNAVKNTALHEERIYTVDPINGILSSPTGETAFPYYVYSASKAWVNGNIMYTGGTNDGSNFNVNGEVKILSPTTTFGLSEMNGDTKLLVYPNPVTSSVFKVDLPFNGQQTLNIYDLSGKIIRKINCQGDADFELIDRQNLQAGIYIIEVLAREHACRTKIVLQ